MVLTEVELMGECSPLYTSFALESFANTCLGMFFVYLSMLITSKSKLKTPARDSVFFLSDVVTNRYKDVMQIVHQWGDMPNCSLDKRFRFCRKVNATICQFSAVVTLLAITRWLHINNVNGFRYLGYSLTCPPMQAEILVLIAPVVPCYKFFVYLSSSLTFMMLITGWIASCMHGDLWTGQIMDWYEGNFETDLGLTTKGWMFVASCAGLLYLAFFQLPMVLVLYFLNRGPKAGLPEGFPRMIALVWVTWMCFPVWWSISFEGFKLINDTKMNGIGFVLLNMVSKGGFTLSILRMVRFHKQKGLIDNATASDGEWLGQFGETGEDSQGSDAAVAPRPTAAPPQGMQPVASHISGDAWFTGILGKYEGDDGKAGSGMKMAPVASHLSGDAWFTSILGKYEQGRTGAAPQPGQAAAGAAAPTVGTADAQSLVVEVMNRIAAGELALVRADGAAALPAKPVTAAREGAGVIDQIAEEEEDETPVFMQC